MNKTSKKNYKTTHIYPSKKEILNNLIETDKTLIKIFRGWMATSWKKAKNKSEKQKFLALKELIQVFAIHLESPVLVEYKPSIASCCYSPSKKTIFLNNSLSIISSMHELGHHLLGESELLACTWSLSYFIEAFPKSYAKLHWDGHLLRK